MDAANVSECPLFKGLSLKELQQCLDSITYQVKRYSKHDYIANAGDELTGQYILLEGTVTGEMVDVNDKKIKIEDIHSPRPLATAFVFGGNHFFPVNLYCQNDVRVMIIPKAVFVNLLQKHERILYNYLNIISSRAQFLSEKIKFLSFRTIKGKIAHYLFQLSDKMHSEQIELPESQTSLASLFGVTRPSLARALGDLEKQGMIVIAGRQIKILNKDALKMQMD